MAEIKYIIRLSHRPVNKLRGVWGAAAWRARFKRYRLNFPCDRASANLIRRARTPVEIASHSSRGRKVKPLVLLFKSGGGRGRAIYGIFRQTRCWVARKYDAVKWQAEPAGSFQNGEWIPSSMRSNLGKPCHMEKFYEIALYKPQPHYSNICNNLECSFMWLRFKLMWNLYLEVYIFIWWMVNGDGHICSPKNKPTCRTFFSFQTRKVCFKKQNIYYWE